MTKEEAIKKFLDWKKIPYKTIELERDDNHFYKIEKNYYFILTGSDPLIAIADDSSEYVILCCPDRYLIDKESGRITESPILVA